MLCFQLKVLFSFLIVQLTLRYFVIGFFNKEVIRAISGVVILYILCYFKFTKIANIFLVFCIADLLFDIIVLIGMKLGITKASSPKEVKLSLIKLVKNK